MRALMGCLDEASHQHPLGLVANCFFFFQKKEEEEEEVLTCAISIMFRDVVSHALQSKGCLCCGNDLCKGSVATCCL